MFKKFLVAIALLWSVGAQADTYNYSYVFGSGVIATGSFTGTANGNLIHDLTEITLQIDGVPIAGSGTLYGSHFQSPNNWVTGGAIASFDGLQNNFMFSDVNFPSQYNFSVLFQSYSDPIFSDFGRGTNYANVYNYFTSQAAYDRFDNIASSAYSEARWTLVAAPVPEPETYAMMLAGLGVMGAVARRRTVKKTA